MTWRCRFETSTLSKSITPIVPTPDAARYSAEGEPSPPAPITSTRAALSFSWPATPISRSDEMAAVAFAVGGREHEARRLIGRQKKRRYVRRRSGATVGSNVFSSEVDRDQAEDLPAERVVHLRPGVAVARAGRARALSRSAADPCRAGCSRPRAACTCPPASPSPSGRSSCGCRAASRSARAPVAVPRNDRNSFESSASRFTSPK